MARAAAPATPQQTVAPAAPTADVDAAERAADQVYKALDGWNDEDAAISALTGHDAPTRALIRQRFRERHDTELAEYLDDQLDGKDLVRAIALLHSTHTHDLHTQMALTMYGRGTRDEELFRILESMPLAGRKEMQRRYDEVFGPIGSGSLCADLDDDLSGWELEKATALLHHDLTEAEQLYLDSVGIAGTREDSVIGYIQGAWSGGVARMAKLESDWKRLVNNQEQWTTETWTSMSLREAMEDELSGEPLELVLAVLDQYERLQSTQGATASPVAVEDARLAAAHATLDAATTGGYTGLGTNVDQVFRAVAEIRTIWQQRLRRAAGTPEEAGLRAQWEQEQTHLLAVASSEMDEDSADYRRVRLLLAGNLGPADEVYLAKVDLDSDKVVDLVTRTWAAGRMDELLAQANVERRDDAGQVLRPRFDPLRTVPMTSGMPWRRVARLAREGEDDAARGAARLKLELDDDDSDGALRHGYDLVKDASAPLRTGTIRAFAEAHLGDVEGSTPTSKFITYIQRRYENSYTCFDFADLLDPAASAQTRLERAQGRMAASHTGALDVVLTGITSAWGAVTAEQSGQVAQESLDRLRLIAAHERADDTELDAMAAMLGKPKEELSALEYEAFKVRLSELRSLRQAIVDAFATAVEVVVSAAVTLATGGAAGGLLLASLASALAGMALREGLQGTDYEFTSDENLQRLVVEITAAGMGSFGGVLAKGVGESAELAKLARTQFMRGALQDAFQAFGRVGGEAAFSNRMPSAEDIAARALTIVGAAGGGGAGRVLGRGAEDLATAAEQLRRNVGAAMTNQLIAGMSEEAASVMQTGMGDMTGLELVGRFARRGATSVLSGMVSGAADTAAQRRLRQSGAEIEDLPDASIISGGDRPFTPQESDHVYATCRRDTPNREVAMLENTTTGERIVVQGHATLGFGDTAAFQQVWHEFQKGRSDGPWRLLRHSHPTDPTTGVTPPAMRVPSGRGGDLTIVEQEAQQTGRAVEHTIDITTEPGKSDQVRYGYDPASEQPFWVEVPDGAGGRRRVPFASYEAYHEWYETQFGHSPEVRSTGPAAPIPRDLDWPARLTDLGATQKQVDFVNELLMRTRGLQRADQQLLYEFLSAAPDLESALAALRTGSGAPVDLNKLRSIVQEGAAVRGASYHGPWPELPREPGQGTTVAGRARWGEASWQGGYGHSVRDHGPELEAANMSQTAKNAIDRRTKVKGLPQGQFYDERFIVEAEQRAPLTPGEHIVDMGRPVGRVYLPDGSIDSDVRWVLVVRKPDGTLRTSYPITAQRAGHPQ